MAKILILLTAAVVLIGCSSGPAVRVADAEGIAAVSAIGMGCGKPFALTQDCSGWSGPTKKISVGGRELKVAANAEGNITVVFGGDTEGSNLGFELLKRELVTRGYEIVKVTPIESAGVMFGYAIETTEPNYHLWNEFAVD